MLCCTWFRGIWAGPPHQSLITPTRFIPCPGHEAVELRGHGNHQLQRGCWKLGQQIWAWRSLQKRPVQQLWGAALPCAWHPSQGLGRQGLAHPARIQVLWLWNHTLGLQTHHGSFLNLCSTAWKKDGCDAPWSPFSSMSLTGVSCLGWGWMCPGGTQMVFSSPSGI